jgi:hypothetical protein
MVSDEDPPREANLEQASLKLAQGLKTCHSVVDNYRAMLGGEANDNGPEDRSQGANSRSAAPTEPEA